jgi:ubiquinone biosynthesis protein COQ9
LSELIKWFEKRRETKALATIQQHSALTTSIVEDLEKAVAAAVNNKMEDMRTCIERVASNEERQTCCGEK